MIDFIVQQEYYSSSAAEVNGELERVLEKFAAEEEDKIWTSH